MDDEEPPPTLDEQFDDFVKLGDPFNSGERITLRKCDYWFHQADILDNVKIKLTDTGHHYNLFTKWSLTFDEFVAYLEHICIAKNIDFEEMKESLIMCGPAGSKNPYEIPKYRVRLEEELKHQHTHEE